MSTILITGASSGIGRALTLQLLRQGHVVWGIARNEEKLKQLSLDAGSPNFFYTVCDVSDFAGLQRLKDYMDGKGFKPNILMLNAGITSSIPETNRKTNYEGVVNAWQVFKADLRKNGGVVAISGSLFALLPASFNISYSQSKLDALNFIKGLAQEKENQSIKFTYFVLGPVNTTPGVTLPLWKSLFIPSAEKTATYITKHLGSTGLIDIFPVSSKVMILLNAMLPKAVMDRLITFLKR